jgi:hypothetical protein
MSPVAQQRIDLEHTQWLEELRATIGDELGDVHYTVEVEDAKSTSIS